MYCTTKPATVFVLTAPVGKVISVRLTRVLLGNSACQSCQEASGRARAIVLPQPQRARIVDRSPQQMVVQATAGSVLMPFMEAPRMRRRSGVAKATRRGDNAE